MIGLGLICEISTRRRLPSVSLATGMVGGNGLINQSGVFRQIC
jgi:hypothetical protein